MKTNLDKLVMTDAALEDHGVDFVFGSVTFRIRRFGGKNSKVKAANAKYFKPHARAIEMGTIEDETAETITIKAFVDACLVDWEGLLDENGNEIPCNATNAYELFKGRLELFNVLLAHAKDHKNFLKDEFHSAEAMGN